MSAGSGRALAAFLVLLAGSAGHAGAACPSASGLPASYRHERQGARQSATATVVLPAPADVVRTHADTVRADPTWTNLEPPATGLPQAVSLKPLLTNDKLKERLLELDASPAPECPGASRLTVRFTWSVGALARLMGGDARDLPALLPLAIRDEILARVLATPETARLLTGEAPSEGALLLRVAPMGLEIEDSEWPAPGQRLETLQGEGAGMGDALGLFLDVHRHAIALAGFGSLSAAGEIAILRSGACAACDVGYAIEVEGSPGGKTSAVAFSLSSIERPPG